MRLRAIAEGPRLKEAVMAGAQRVADDLRDYYGAKDADEPNSFFAKGEGTRRTHFWRKVGDSVRGPERTQRGAVVFVTHPVIRQKLLGGPISAVRALMLTIPINAEAYARRAKELEGIVGRLFIVKAKDGRVFLAGRPERRGKTVFYYRLKESVNQKPWKGAVPTRRWLIDSFRAGAGYYLRHHN